MAEYGAKLTADASGFVAGVGESTKAQAKLNDELAKGGGAAKSASAEAKAFVDRVKEMSETLGKTRAEIERYRAAQLDLTTAQRASVDASLKSIETHDKNAAAMTALRTTALAAGLAIGAYAVTTALAVKNTIEHRAELYHLSESLGVAVPALSTMQYQLKLSGVNSEAFGLSMRGLTKNISEAQRGVGDGAQLFRLLSDEVYTAAARGASLEELLPLMAEAFSHFADGPNKSALAIQFFGRAGEQMIPLLNRGAAGFKAAAEEAKLLGVVTGDLTAYQAHKLEEELVRLDANLGAMKRRLASDIVPVLLEVAERFNRAAASGQGLAGVIGVLAGQGGGAMAEQMGAGGLALNFAPPPAALAAPTAARIEAMRASFRQSEMTGQTRAAPVPPGEFEAMQAQLSASEQLTQHALVSSQALTASQQALVQLQAQYAAGLSKLSPEREKEIEQTLRFNAAKERELANRQRDIDLGKIIAAGIEARTTQQQSEADALAAQSRGYRDHLGDLDLEIQLLKDDTTRQQQLVTTSTNRIDRIRLETQVQVEANIARERAVGLRKIELDLQREMMSLGPEPSPDAVTEAYRRAAQAQQDLNAKLDVKGAVQYAHDLSVKTNAEVQAQFDRTADNIERTLSTALVTGFMQGGKSGAQVLKRALEATFATLVLEPLLKPILMPVAQFASALSMQIFGTNAYAAGGGTAAMPLAWSGFGNAASAGSGSTVAGYGGAGDVAMASPGGFGSAGYVPFAAAAYQGSQGNWGGAGAGLAGATIGTAIMPGIGTAIGYAIGSLVGSSSSKGFNFDKYIKRTGQFSGGFGQAGALANGFAFTGPEGPAMSAFATAEATAEQNIIRNLGLSPAQVGSVNAALMPLGSRSYQFGNRNSDITQSGAFESIQADRLRAISAVLGKSIEDLTSVMSLSADQFQSRIDSLQSAYDTGVAQIKGLKNTLGITTLEQFQNALAIAPDQSPLDRVAAARSQYDALLARVKGGDYTAVSDFTGSANTLLGIDRDVYASGPEFQRARDTVLSDVSDALAAERAVLNDIPATLLQANADNLQAVKSQTTALVAKLDEIKQELFRLRGS